MKNLKLLIYIPSSLTIPIVKVFRLEKTTENIKKIFAKILKH